MGLWLDLLKLAAKYPPLRSILGVGELPFLPAGERFLPAGLPFLPAGPLAQGVTAKPEWPGHLSGWRRHSF